MKKDKKRNGKKEEEDGMNRAEGRRRGKQGGQEKEAEINPVLLKTAPFDFFQLILHVR